MKHLLRSVRSVLVAAVVVVLASCGGGVDADSYAKLKTGMTATEVEAILGKPTDTGGGGIGALTAGAKTWKSGDKEISIVFANEKVVTFTKKGF